jgi:hypothetical protein
MTPREKSEARMTEALDAYRAAAHAEADGYFDERALEAQRVRILARLEQAGQRARVLPFPGAGATPRLGPSHSRRWISAAAAAGLFIGLVTGQLLHVMPGDNWVHREPVRVSAPPGRRWPPRRSIPKTRCSTPSTPPSIGRAPGTSAPSRTSPSTSRTDPPFT